MKVTNNAAAPRGFNVLRKVGKDIVPDMVLLQPGEMVEDVEVNPEDKVFLGMVKTRDLLVEDAPKAVVKAADAAPQPQVEPVKPAADTREAVDPKLMTPEQVSNTKQNKSSI